MSHYDLTGVGVQALTPASSRLFIAIQVAPLTSGNGRANPTNRFDIGLLRLGVDDWYYPPVPVDADQMVLDLPSGVDQLGYSLFQITEIGVDEDTPPAPATTSVSTDLDGTAASFGDAVTITFMRSDTPDVSDFVGIVDSGWNTGFGRSFGYINTPNFPYTSSGTDTMGGSASASGTASSTLASPFGGAPATVFAVYVDGPSNSVIATGPTFTVS
jgi:hypothetical protein